ncbi:MAG: chorismate--pyruvate lyase [Eubacterium sp.]
MNDFLTPCDYIVVKIDGDYAHLKRVDLPNEEPVLVARALLPLETDENTRLHYEMLTYTII